MIVPGAGLRQFSARSHVSRRAAYHASAFVRYTLGMEQGLEVAVRRLAHKLAAIERRVARLEGEAAKAPPPPRGRSVQGK
jgi:hypothetical protein